MQRNNVASILQGPDCHPVTRVPTKPSPLLRPTILRMETGRANAPADN